jgi:hypothetical protein
MISAQIKIRLLGFIPWTIHRQVPQTYAEMSLLQLLWWAEHVYGELKKFMAVKEKEVEITDESGMIARQIASMPVLLRIWHALFKYVDIETLSWMLWKKKVAIWMWQQPFDLEENPVLMLQGLRGPKVEDEIEVWEFMFADAFYLAYRQTEEVKYLDMMTGQLYRDSEFQIPDSEKMVARAVYNELHDTTEQMAKAKKAEKLLFVAWYERWRNALGDEHKYIFSKSNENKARKQESWLPVILEVSGGIANVAAVKRMSANLFLADCNRLAKKNHDLEKHLEKQKK